MNTRTEESSGRLSRRLLIFVWAALLMGAAGVKAEPVKTLVQDTLYRADGSVAHGKVSIRWGGFSTSVGEAVAAGEMTVATDANGGISIPLIANTGSVPSGGYYQVVIKLDDGTTSEEMWVVPAAASTTVSAIRAKVMPKAVAAQFVSRDYVDTALGTLAANPTVHLSGAESIQGAKTFLVSPEMPVPTDAGGAANKGYVDQQVSGLSVNLASPGAVGLTTPGTVNATGYSVNGLPLSSRNLGDGATLPQLDSSGKLMASAIPNNTANTTGNAGTATALASTPAQCTSGQFSTGVTVSGAANCTPVAYAQIVSAPPIPNLNTPGPIGKSTPGTVDATSITASGILAVGTTVPTTIADVAGIISPNVNGLLTPIGMDATGVADSSPALQAAVNLARPQGTCVQLPSGRFNLLTPITLTGGECILGFNGTRYGSGGTNLLPATAAFVTAAPLSQLQNLYLKDVSIVGGSNAIDLGEFHAVHLFNIGCTDQSGWCISQVRGEKSEIRFVNCWHHNVTAQGCISLADPTNSLFAATYSGAGFTDWWWDKGDIDFVLNTGPNSYTIWAGKNLGESKVSNIHTYLNPPALGIIHIGGNADADTFSNITVDNTGTSGAPVPAIFEVDGEFRNSTLDKLTPAYAGNNTYTIGAYFKGMFLNSLITNSQLGGDNITRYGVKLDYPISAGGEIIGTSGSFFAATSYEIHTRSQVNMIGMSPTNALAALNWYDGTNTGASLLLQADIGDAVAATSSFTVTHAFGGGGYKDTFAVTPRGPRAPQGIIGLPHIASNGSPVNGDLWTTSAGVFAQINGVTVGPLGGLANPMTSVGDLIVGGSSGTPTRVAAAGTISQNTTGTAGGLTGSPAIAVGNINSGGIGATGSITTTSGTATIGFTGTAFSSLGAGIIAVGNGTNGDVSGQLRASQFRVTNSGSLNSINTNTLTANYGETLPNGNSAAVMAASLVTTAATSDTVTVQGMTALGHCSLTATNAAAATNIATTFVSAKAVNQITVTHTASASMNYDVMCTPN